MDFDNDDKLDFGALPPAVDHLLQQGVASHFSDPAAAEAAFRAAIALDPGTLPAYRCLFKHYNRKRQFDAAYQTVLDWLAEAAREAGISGDWQRWTAAPRTVLAALKGYATATDLADYLVKKGLPFRDAHEAVGLAVKTAEFKGVDLPGLTLEELQQFSPLIENDVFSVLTVEGSLASRNHIGGTAPEQVKAAIVRARKHLG